MADSVDYFKLRDEMAENGVALIYLTNQQLQSLANVLDSVNREEIPGEDVQMLKMVLDQHNGRGDIGFEMEPPWKLPREWVKQ